MIVINRNSFDFPAVTFVGQTGNSETTYAYFNTKAKPLFDGYGYVKVLKATQHIFLIPQIENGTNHLKILRTRGYVRVCSVLFKDLGLKDKAYKIYKYKQGFAIKLNEPIHQKGGQTSQ